MAQHSFSTMTKNPAAVALGRLGGLKGGKARAAAMTPEQRQESARKAGSAPKKKRRKLADIPNP